MYEEGFEKQDLIFAWVRRDYDAEMCNFVKAKTV